MIADPHGVCPCERLSRLARPEPLWMSVRFRPLPRRYPAAASQSNQTKFDLLPRSSGVHTAVSARTCRTWKTGRATDPSSSVNLSGMTDGPITASLSVSDAGGLSFCANSTLQSKAQGNRDFLRARARKTVQAV